MSYSRNSPIAMCDPSREPLAGDAGVPFESVARGDLSDWVELMEVVEALCPVWPPHEPIFRGEFKL